MDDQANAVDRHTQKAGKISLHPLKFEDALKSKPPEKQNNKQPDQRREEKT